MPKPMILGLSHDTCPHCGKNFQMKADGRLFHHGHPARRCPGAGEYGTCMKEWLGLMAAKHNLLDGYEQVTHIDGPVRPSDDDPGRTRQSDELSQPIEGPGPLIDGSEGGDA